MARRKSLTIAIRPKGKGFEARPSVDGKQISVYRSTRKEVEDELIRLHQQKTRQERGNTTLAEFIAIWNDREDKRALNGERSQATAVVRRQQLEAHVVPALGHIMLRSLDKDIIREFTEKGQERLRKASLGESTIKGSRAFQAAFTALSSCLSEAVDDGLIEVNPCKTLGKRSAKPRHQRAPLEILEWKHIQAVLDFAKADETRPYYVYFLLVLAATTGMRQGEIFALRWEDIDFKAKTVSVNKSVGEGIDEKFVEKEPKTKSGRRTILIPGWVVDEMQVWKAASSGRPGKLIFCDTEGRWLDRHNFMNRHYKPLLEAAGVPIVTFHSLRHSHASELIAGGVNIKVISTRLGHSSVSFTLDTYGHLFSDGQEAAVSLYNRMVPGKKLRAVN